MLERTFAILEIFRADVPEWGTSEIARALELPVPTVHRILSALRGLGYVTQDAQTRRFRLGPAALGLGAKARALADIRTVSLQPLRRLASELSETSLLTGLGPGRDASICLERVESSQPLRLSLEPGRQLPLHAGASQKALLAFMPQEEADVIVDGPLVRLCRSTITEPRRLRQELDLIRERGFATSYEETNVGVWGVAVPVVSDSDVTCAVGIAAPSPRLNTALVRRSVRRSHATAGEIARSLDRSVPRLVLATLTAGLTTERKRP